MFEGITLSGHGRKEASPAPPVTWQVGPAPIRHVRIRTAVWAGIPRLLPRHGYQSRYKRVRVSQVSKHREHPDRAASRYSSRRFPLGPGRAQLRTHSPTASLRLSPRIKSPKSGAPPPQPRPARPLFARSQDFSGEASRPALRPSPRSGSSLVGFAVSFLSSPRPSRAILLWVVFRIAGRGVRGMTGRRSRSHWPWFLIFWPVCCIATGRL
jgi:hypothetical protein